MNSEQKDLFKTQQLVTGSRPVTIELRGLEVQWREQGKLRTLKGIPSFKTGKTAFGWIDRQTNKVQARPLTLPQHKKWMELATLSIESQLRSALGITEEKIRTVASAQSWIASQMPLDDSWTWVPEILVKCRLCEPGEAEGATILIERL